MAVSFIKFFHILLFYFVSLYIWLYVLFASAEFFKLCILTDMLFITFMFMYSYCYVRMFRSGYSVFLCCSVYCLCVIMYCTTATWCQPNCS